MRYVVVSSVVLSHVIMGHVILGRAIMSHAIHFFRPAPVSSANALRDDFHQPAY